ncbi:MAG TPA: IS110 family transposase, partial [Rubrobacter sp.]|nr:IS110 family transposase [Rubrobacter sp.]
EYVPALCMSFELGAAQWKIAFSPGLGQRPRFRIMQARDLTRLQQEIAAAKVRFGFSQDAAVLSCYEAGRDGFWLHRALESMGVRNYVVDSASIEVKRRKKKVKTDRLDASKLVEMLLRFRLGEHRVWSVVRVPSVEEEDRRHLHRELATAKRDRNRIVCRIKSFLFTQGLWVQELKDLPERLEKIRLWDGAPLPAMLQERLEREWQRLRFATEQVQQLYARRRALLRKAEDRGSQIAAKLMRLRSLGADGSWLLSMELYSWRQFQNGRQIGALCGLTPTPYQSGDESKELGISKAGNRAIRHMAIELAWSWLRYQPQSELSQWYQRRFGHGKSRFRRIGIVALARKLLIALWRYLETGVPPAGALLKA